jgi:hypothetical protein
MHSRAEHGPVEGRSGRGKKRGLLHRTGIALPAAGLALLLVAVVWGGVTVLSPGGAGANSISAEINGLGTSQSATGITSEFNTITSMMAASQVLTVTAAPAHTDPDQIMIANGTAMGVNEAGSSVAVAAPNDVAQNQADAKELLPSFGFSVASQWTCLEEIWTTESSWNVYAENTSSGAYGIPQALPADKMATIAPDWQTNPITQIKWGLGYIQSRYGTPCAAEAHEQADHFY